MSILNRQFRVALLLLILIEELSFLGYLAPAVNTFLFFSFVLLALILSVRRPEYALWLVLIELIIGSKGYLFFVDFGATRISIRLALWSIVMLAWLLTAALTAIREKKLTGDLRAFFLSLKTKERRYWALLALLVVWGAVNGYFISKNGLSGTFFDANAWIFFLLVFPAFPILRKRENLERFLPLALAALVWLACKTFFLSFIFSHYTLETPAFRLYRWVRVSGVGEITQVKGGFYRIFFQSQIYLLMAYLTAVYFLVKKISTDKFSRLLRSGKFWVNFIFCSMMLSAILLSLSRSFWLGLAAGLSVVGGRLAWMLFKSGQKVSGRLAFSIAAFAGSLFVSAFFVALIVTFPKPTPIGGFDTGSLLGSRVDSDEAAVVSRWELLPKLWHKILEQPILGRGFGSTVTYQSKDPRQLLSPSRGVFTTYAFEWGWLDIWYKLGVFGILAYGLLIHELFVRGLTAVDQSPWFADLKFGLLAGLLALSVTHFFSPYLNHPLGIGYLIFLFSIL